MSNKRIRLPKDGLERTSLHISPNPAAVDGAEDVEGHGFVNPAPPADFSKPGPSSGGEFVPNNDDGKAPPAD